MTIVSAATPIGFINITDRERGVAFYRDVLELEFLRSDEFGDLFATTSAKLRITAMSDFKPSGHPAFGWEVLDLDRTMNLLAAKSIEFTIYPGFGQDDRGVWTSPDGGTRLAWLTDPDGNVLMLSQG